jgi:hypothetical protein
VPLELGRPYDEHIRGQWADCLGANRVPGATRAKRFASESGNPKSRRLPSRTRRSLTSVLASPWCCRFRHRAAVLASTNDRPSWPLRTEAGTPVPSASNTGAAATARLTHTHGGALLTGRRHRHQDGGGEQQSDDLLNPVATSRADPSCRRSRSRVRVDVGRTQRGTSTDQIKPSRHPVPTRLPSSRAGSRFLGRAAARLIALLNLRVHG